MPTIQQNRFGLDQTIIIYDSFYDKNYVVDAAKFDIVYGFFYEKNENKTIASNLTANIFRISQETGIDVLTLIDELGSLPNKLELNRKIAYYLNLLKSKTSLYGVSRIPTPNLPAARNVVI
jgi:hypothetical protein